MSSRPPRGGRGLKYPTRRPLRTVGVSRPPRGGRGLKLCTSAEDAINLEVAPLAGGVD